MELKSAQKILSSLLILGILFSSNAFTQTEKSEKNQPESDKKTIYRFKNNEKDIEQLFDAIKKGARPTDPNASPPAKAENDKKYLKDSLRDKLRDRFNNDEDAVPRSLDDIQSLREMLNEHLRQFFNESFHDDNFFDDSFFKGLHPFTDRQLSPGMKDRSNLTGQDEIKIREEKDRIVYEVDLGKVDEKTLDIKISKGQIQISGQSHIESKEETEYGTTSSTFISSFSRAFALPKGVKEDQVKIEKTDKNLMISVPKK